MPALDRYNGVFFRVLKKYLREGQLEDVDILILSETLGILTPEKGVPYNPVISKVVGRGDTDKARKQNLETLRNWFSKREYAEIYVNCGRDFLKLIEGFEKLTSARVTFAEGSGIGPKAAHMKKWIVNRTAA
jgi:hypothetical protein